MAQIRAKVREQTGRNRARLPLEWAVENVNHAVRGWGNYFRYGNSAAKFSAIDSYVNERLAILASAKHGLQGRNWVTRFNYEWATRLGVYRLSGTVRPTLAYASRGTVSVSRVRENRMHGSMRRREAARCRWPSGPKGRVPPADPTRSALVRRRGAPYIAVERKL